MTWFGASTNCNNKNSTLASVHSLKENEFLAKLSQDSLPKMSWIGGNDIAKENDWVWTDKTAWDFNNWSSDWPKNDGDCILVMNIDEAWYNMNCIMKLASICKRNLV